MYITRTFSDQEHRELDEHVAEATATIRRALADRSSPLLAYSGGKDAAVVAHLVRHTIGPVPAVCETSYYFDDQVAHVERSAAAIGFPVLCIDSLSYAWLAAHPEYVFVRDAALRSRFFSLRQQRTVARTQKRGGHDVVFFGRRLADGNVVKAPIYDRAGVRQCHPLRRWREEHIWLYFQRHRIEVPPIYATPYGRNQGNGPWNIYMASPDHGACWQAIFETGPEVVARAAAVLPAAREFLESKS